MRASGVALVADSVTARMGRAIGFGSQLLRTSGAAVRRLRLTLAQFYAVTVRSTVPLALAGLLVGMALAVQGSYALDYVQGEGTLGGLVALPLARELGPVIAALIFAGVAGSAWAAEIARLKANEQLAALEMMGVDPLGRVFAPRFAAGVLALPLLAALFVAVGVGGGYLVALGVQGIAAESFWSQVQANLGLGREIGAGLLKSAIFGALVTGIALFEGAEAEAVPEGVSRAATRAMVRASVAVLAFNLLLTVLVFT